VAQEFVWNAQARNQWWRAYAYPKLDALVTRGLLNSPDLQAANHRLSAAREQLTALNASTTVPQIDVGGQANRARQLTLPLPPVPPTAVYDIFLGQVQAKYTFDLFGATRYANKRLAWQTRRQFWQLQAARQALAANIVTTAIRVAALRVRIDATERLLRLAQEDAREMQRRQELGAVAPHDLMEANRSAMAVAAILPGLHAQHLVARHGLALLLGVAPQQAPQDLEFDRLAVPQRIPVTVPSELLKIRPDIQAADAALKSAAAEVGAATAQMYPSLTLSAAMGKGGFDWSSAMGAAGSIWSIGASLTAPLFHGGALRAEARAARNNYQAAVQDYKQTVLAAFGKVADLLLTLQQDADALLAADMAQEAAKQALADVRAQVRLGALAPAAARAREQLSIDAQLNALTYAEARLSNTAALFTAIGTQPLHGQPPLVQP
jgi:NodT family efflux transporter outer membrane factor (OMF) lipoprotein